MLLQCGKTQRKTVEIELGVGKPRYGETLTMLIEGTQVRAKVTAVWRSPPPTSGVYMINADEIERGPSRRTGT
jgi:hypothetical protein